MYYNQKINQFAFDIDKSIEALLYIASHTKDLYHILKILYFADKMHLDKYGRFISGDSYSAMRNGPVPSELYDIIKHVRGDGYYSGFNASIKDAFKVENDGKDIIPLRNPELNKLSESEIECLDRSIKENMHLTFNQLKDKSHDSAFKSADENDFISIEKIAESLDNKELMEYLRGMYQS